MKLHFMQLKLFWIKVSWDIWRKLSTMEKELFYWGIINDERNLIKAVCDEVFCIYWKIVNDFMFEKKVAISWHS